MALALIREDGTGKPDANSYASVAEGDSYFEGHMYAGVWSGAGEAEKAVVLVACGRRRGLRYGGLFKVREAATDNSCLCITLGVCFRWRRSGANARYHAGEGRQRSSRAPCRRGSWPRSS